MGRERNERVRRRRNGLTLTFLHQLLKSSKCEPDGCVLVGADAVGPLGLKERLTAAVPRGTARVTPNLTLQQNLMTALHFISFNLAFFNEVKKQLRCNEMRRCLQACITSEFLVAARM